MTNLELMLFKRFTGGNLEGLTYTDKIKVKTINDLTWLDCIGGEFMAYSSSPYRIDNVYIYDRDTDSYLTRKQAEWRLKGY